MLAITLLGSLAINLLLLAAVGVKSLANPNADRGVREKYYSHRAIAANKVAVVSLEGVILTGEGFINRQIDQVLNDPSVKAVVLRVDSPGGTVSGSDFIYHRLQKLREERDIPLVISMGGIAASGGYYVAMACGDTPNVVFAEPTTATGSIGVKIPHYDFSEMLGKWGVQEDTVASHRLKTLGSFAKRMTEEERKILQSVVDDYFEQFKNVVKAGRPKFRQDPSALDRLATGQIFTADQALRNGLVDNLGFLDAAVKRAIELARLDPDEVTVVKYHRDLGVLDVLVGGQSQAPQLDPAALWELATPRAYFLCSGLPPWPGSEKP